MRQDADRLLGFMHAAPRPWRDGILWWLDVSPAGAVERRISLRRSRGDAVGGGTMPASSHSTGLVAPRFSVGGGRWAVPQYLHGAVVAGRQPAGLMAAGCRRRPDSHHQLDVSTVNMLEQHLGDTDDGSPKASGGRVHAICRKTDRRQKINLPSFRR